MNAKSHYASVALLMLVFSCSENPTENIIAPVIIPSGIVEITDLKEILHLPGECGTQMECEGKDITVRGYIDFLNTCDPDNWGHGMCHDGMKFFLCSQKRGPSIGDVLGMTYSFIEVKVRPKYGYSILQEIWGNYEEGKEFSDEVHVTATIQGFDWFGCKRYVHLVLKTNDNIQFVYE